MLNVTFYRNRYGVYGYEVKGHATAIVCAGISALTQTVAMTMMDYSCGKFCILSYDNGYTSLKLKPTGQQFYTAKVLFGALTKGIETIADEHHDEVMVSYYEEMGR